MKRYWIMVILNEYINAISLMDVVHIAHICALSLYFINQKCYDLYKMLCNEPDYVQENAEI